MRDVVVRLISARQAGKAERNEYLGNRFNKQSKDEN
jgi:uncharacterized DUF497 family protein